MNQKNKYLPKNLPMDEIVDRYVNQMEFIPDLAKEYGVTYTTMKNKLTKAGVQFRDKKEEKKRVMNREEIKKKVSEGSKRSSDKRKATNLKRYGHETAMCSDSIKSKWQKEHEEKHGVIWGTQREDSIEKRKQTLLNEYGVDNASRIPGVSEKISQNRWKNKSEEELKIIIDKMQDLSPGSKKNHSDGIKLNRWKNKSEEELKEIQNKTKDTWINNFGYDNPNKRPEAKILLKKQKIELFLKYRLDFMLNYLNLELLSDRNNWINANTRYDFKCKICQTIFNQYYADIAYGRLSCPGCTPTGSSKAEQEIINYIEKELFISRDDLRFNSKQIIPPYELDIYIPSKNIALEYNGLYWHREGNHNFNKNYHLNKTNLCKEKGIRLIHIFEDEWIFKRDIVKKIIKKILKIKETKLIHARQCEIKEINSKIKNEFLEKFHLQSYGMPSKINLGAFYNNKLISVMTFSSGNLIKGIKPTDGVFELNRFSSDYNYHIPGIASKLLSYFKKNYTWEKIYTYADKRWSEGNLYFKLGFEYIGDTLPTESYIYGLKRVHKFSLRKLDQIKNLESTNPEWKIRLNQGYYRIWDCGHKKFQLLNKSK